MRTLTTSSTSPHRKRDFLKLENKDKRISSNEKFNVNNDPQFSLLTEFWETTEASRERSAEQLFNDLESVTLVTEVSNLGASGNRFEPAASCVNDTYAISNKCVASRLMSLWEMPAHVVWCYFGSADTDASFLVEDLG